MGATISIENAVKRFGNDTIINGLNLDIRPGEFFTLLGPSGCGKTTLLRMIIGFNTIEGGTFKINNQVINDIPTNKRNIGMVFQNYAVFPHMSVFDNVAFGLKNRKLPKAEIQEKVDAILKVVKIDHLKDRMPAKLSGGQAARVALLRVFATKPEVLLLDEVDAALDDASAQAVGALTAEVVGQEATCLRIRHRSPDGRAFGTFHLEGGCLSYAEGGRGRMSEAVPASEGSVAASPSSGLDRSPAASPGSGLDGSPAASSTRAPERPSASAPTEGGES